MEAGRELDVLIGEKVMGWKGGGLYWINANGAATELYEDYPGYECGERSEDAWSPSTSIAAAWQVVEKLREHGLYLIINDTIGQYRARFFKVGWDIFTWMRVPDSDMTVWENTAPHAICLAALKAVGVNTEEMGQTRTP